MPSLRPFNATETKQKKKENVDDNKFGFVSG